jgi:predicted nucleotidyltransferase
VSVYLFGSRSKGTHLEFSDIDLAFLSTEDISEELTLLMEIIE